MADATIPQPAPDATDRDAAKRRQCLGGVLIGAYQEAIAAGCIQGTLAYAAFVKGYLKHWNSASRVEFSPTPPAV